MNVNTERSSSCASLGVLYRTVPPRDTRQELGMKRCHIGGMDMGVCQTGVPCVWGRRHADTVVCSLPRCVVFQLRTGYLDRLRGGWVKYGAFQKEVERVEVEMEIESASLDDAQSGGSAPAIVGHPS